MKAVAKKQILQVHVSPFVKKTLKRLAKSSGVSMADLAGEMLDKMIKQKQYKYDTLELTRIHPKGVKVDDLLEIVKKHLSKNDR